MPFVLAKTLLALIVPPAGFLIIMAFGFLIVRSCRGCGKFLIAVSFVGLYLAAISPVSDRLLKPLEAYAPPFSGSGGDADAIVVLGGGVLDLEWTGLEAEPGEAALERLIKGVELYHRLHLPLVLTGGCGDPVKQETPDGDAMARVARSLGVPAKSILVENKSRNTAEGARALAALIRGERIILVTSAYHMKRAAGMYRKQGFQVIPAPAAYMSEQRTVTWHSFIPDAGDLDASATACREYISLFWYRINGELSPA